MTVATFRFYEELNDFLAPDRRKVDFPYRCVRAATVKNAMEAIGVTRGRRSRGPASFIPASPSLLGCGDATRERVEGTPA
jgi:hypothetical protein